MAKSEKKALKGKAFSTREELTAAVTEAVEAGVPADRIRLFKAAGMYVMANGAHAALYAAHRAGAVECEELTAPPTADEMAAKVAEMDPEERAKLAKLLKTK